jgi:hypothetical protein
MVGDALVGFRSGTTISLSGRSHVTAISNNIFGMPNARMSSCPVFSLSDQAFVLTFSFLAYQMP